MKKNKLFSFGIYRETLRELKMLGIILTSLGVVLSVGGAVINALPSYYPGASTLSSVSVTYVGLLAVYGAALIATLKVFGYVNVRKSSDFYHSLPHTRECVYVSCSAAILTVVISMLIITVGIGAVSYEILPIFTGKDFYIPYGNILFDVLCLAASSLLMVTSVSVAVSLTGTRLMNVLVSALIIVVPRVFISTVTSILLKSAPVLTKASFGVFFFSDSNLLLSEFWSMLTGGTNSVGSLIYTFVLALVYGALACLFFKKRRSEAAHTASVTPLLQAAFRITVAVFLCIWSFIFIAEYGFDSAWVVWYAIVAVIYFAFELITTKKWKNLLRAVPGLFIVAGILVLTYFGTEIAGNIALSYEPSADEIKCVKILSSSDYFDNYFGSYLFTAERSSGRGFAEYAFDKSSNVSIYDREVAKIISDSLKNSNEDAKNGNFEKYGEYKYLKVAITTDKGTKQRYIRVYESNYASVIEKLSENEHYRNNYLNLPEAKKVVFLGDVEIPNGGLSEIYGILKEEIASLDFSDWYNYLYGGVWCDPDVQLCVTVDDGGVTRDVVIPFGKNQAPKAYEKLVTEFLINEKDMGEKAETFAKFCDYCEEKGLDVESGEFAYAYVDCFVYENGEYVCYGLTVDFDKYFYGGGEIGSYAGYISPEEFLPLLKESLKESPDVDRFMRLHLSVNVNTENESGDVGFESFDTVYFPVSDGLFEAIEKASYGDEYATDCVTEAISAE